MGFCNANVIGPNFPSNEEKRHSDALFSDSVIHSLLSHYSAGLRLRVWSLCCGNAFGELSLWQFGKVGIHIDKHKTWRTFMQTQSYTVGGRGDRADSKPCHWGCWTRPKTCQAWMNISEWRREEGDEIIAEAGYDALHCGGQPGWLEREKYSVWREASRKASVAQQYWGALSSLLLFHLIWRLVGSQQSSSGRNQILHVN